MRFGRWKALLCAGAMLLTAAPVGALDTISVFAAEETVATSGTCGENLTWSFDESTGTLTISGTGKMEDYSSSSYSPAPWNGLRKSIKEVVLQDGVNSVGMWAFFGCQYLIAVTIPDSMVSIEECAFYGCTGLTEINISEGVTSIGQGAFFDCTSLNSVTIPGSVTSIGKEAFYDCYSLTSVTIPNGVKSIGSQTFYNCHRLTSITIPNSVMSIGLGAFYNCSSLTTITIPDSVTSIGQHAFAECTGLTTITIPDSVTCIELGAFFCCTNLVSIVIRNPECRMIAAGTYTICNGYIYSEADMSYSYYFTGTIFGCDGSTAQKYAEECGYSFKLLSEAPISTQSEVTLGNINGDTSIDASDAADLLIVVAYIGAGEDSGLTAEQLKAADVDTNGEINAADAAVILQYAAAVGAGQPDVRLEDFR